MGYLLIWVDFGSGPRIFYFPKGTLTEGQIALLKLSHGGYINDGCDNEDGSDFEARVRLENMIDKGAIITDPDTIKSEHGILSKYELDTAKPFKVPKSVRTFISGIVL